jgi:hypothetical protein
MDPIGTTTITSFIAEDTNTVAGSWFSVRALGENGATGRRAYAIEKVPGTFNCFPVDAMAASAPSPGWGVFSTNMDLSAVTVTVEVRNWGTETIVNPTVKYRLDNQPVVAETHNGAIDPDSGIFHTFTAKIDINATGSYHLLAWVECPGDLNPANDTLYIPIEVIEGDVISNGYIQDFDSWAKCSSAPACELYSCTLEQGWINLANITYDDHDWRTFSGPTSTGNTGPDTDHTTGTYTGKYLYTEPSYQCFDRTTILMPPCIDLTGISNPGITLWYHAWGADIGSLHADLFDGSDVLFDIVQPVVGNQGNEWKELVIDLSPWSGQVVAVRFRGITACDQYGDLAIDDFALAEITGTGPVPEKMTGRLLLFPNPAKGEVTIRLQQPGDEIYSLEIIDLSGRIVVSEQVIPLSGQLTVKLNVENLSSGIYMLKLAGRTESCRERLVVY